MNTQNINVKTATPKSSERYGENTNILLQLMEMESKLQVLRSLAAVGCRDEEDFKASFSCADRLAWLYACNLIKTSVAYEIAESIETLGRAIEPAPWEWYFRNFSH
ncbi:hypothetical protein V1951_18210 [Yersinia sp. 2544 StPb PI]|uniref:hypothetical protein n=1 Tax=Yersinia sp. 2544 StPb PI TaxID=3117409 RepID=UPI002AC5C80A|nr:hypothetical protein [Yersinia enterocolitica]